jgi:hypothetical protein
MKLEGVIRSYRELEDNTAASKAYVLTSLLLDSLTSKNSIFGFKAIVLTPLLLDS